MAAPFRLDPRDQEPGWDDRTRGARIRLVLHNDRFLVGPQVVVQHLASHVLGQAQRRVAADWKELHGVAPVLLQTCVAPATRPPDGSAWTGPKAARRGQAFPTLSR